MENKVLAIVDGREITQEDVIHLLQSLGERASAFNHPDGQKQLIEELIMQELLYSDAMEKGLNHDEAFLKALKEMEKSLLTQYATKKLIDNVSVEDNELQDYYNAHTSSFMSKEQAKANHILVSTLEQANEIREEIINGLDFKEAAKKYSTCPSKDASGDLGTFTRGQMVPEFEEVAFSMKPGTISEPVKTQFGYHLIELDELTPAQVLPFDVVKEKVRQDLLLAKRQAEYLAKRDELSHKYKVQVKS